MSLTNIVKNSKSLKGALAGLMLSGAAYSLPVKQVYALSNKPAIEKQDKTVDSFEKEFYDSKKLTVDQIIGDTERVNDSTYQEKVFGSDKPVIVLFYNNNAEGSKGLAFLTEELQSKYEGEINFFAYKMSDGNRTPPNMFRKMGHKYKLENTPALAFYDNDKGVIEREDTMNGGIKTYGFYSKTTPEIIKYIYDDILD